MASPYQQQAFQRKIIYLGCILVLLTGAWVWRQYVLASQARELGVREVNRGEVQLSGEVIRLTLTGSRGLTTCILWMMAIDDQRRNEWNELEQKVDTLTQLQPHFITPWLFQSWNLSYNVSVELDRSSDKYFYIGRGLQLLARGERQNRFNPVIRWSMGFTYQHKICQHDETNVLRSLLQLSCIPPHKRDPNRFLKKAANGGTEINWPEFEAFCKENPQLIRRLNTGIQREETRATQKQFLCSTPEDVVQFLSDNFKILSPYELPPAAPLGGWLPNQDDRLKDEEARYPVLPPPVSLERDSPRPGPSMFGEGTLTPLTSQSTLSDGDDAYLISEAWFAYAMEPLPLPGPLPGDNGQITDRLRQHVPNTMMTSIFRQYPARASSYVAERLQQEGWFDEDPWPIPSWFNDSPGGQDLFSDGTPAQVRVTNGRLSRVAWETAYKMWKRHGEDNHLLLSPVEEKNMRDQAKAFAKRLGLPPGAMAPTLRTEDLTQNEQSEYFAYRYIWAYELHARVTNFNHHFQRSRVEQEKDTVLCRKLFYLVDTLRSNAASRRALRVYESSKDGDPETTGAMAKWRAILLKEGNDEFRKDTLIQEDTAEVQLKYFDMFNREVRPRFERTPIAFLLGVRLSTERFPRSIIPSPFLDNEGKPIVEERTIAQVEQRRVRPGQRQQSKPVEVEQPPETPQKP
jgi:hypothetical protein